MNDPLQPFYFKTIVGMDNRTDELELNGKKVRLAQNCRFRPTPGAVQKRPPLAYYNTNEISGSGGMLGAYRFYSTYGAKLISVRDTGVYVGDDATGTMTQIRTLSNAGRRMTFVTYNNLMIASNGYDDIFVYDGSSDAVTWELGSCKAVTGTGTGITKTGVSYMVTIDDDAYICGAVSNEIASLSNKSVNLSHIPLGPIGTTNRKLYRKDSSTSGAYKYLATIADNSTTTYTDTTADVSSESAVGTVTDDVPKGNILLIHRERLIVSGDPNNPNRWYYANPFLPGYIQTDTNLDYMDIAKDDGDQITGMVVQMGTLICIKQNSMRKVFVAASSANVDPASWYAEDPFTHVGSPAQWSICPTPYGIVFLGWDQWYIYDGSSAPKPIIAQFSTDKILPSLYNDVVAYYNNNAVFAAYADSETAPQQADKTMVYSFLVDEMSIDNISAGCFASASGVDETGELYIGSSYEGYMYKAEEGDIYHRVSSKSQAKNGTEEGVFFGGTESSGTIEIGDAVSPDPIPDDICIFWDKEDTSPGSGWTEISADDRFIKISTTAGTLSSAYTHTHTISGSLEKTSLAAVDGGDSGKVLSRDNHGHSVSSITSGTGENVPRNVRFRVFKKNSSTTEYVFPVGSILMWDQQSAPDGWIPVSTIDGYYIRIGSDELGYGISSSHSHSFDGVSGVEDGPGQDGDHWETSGDPALLHAQYPHRHDVTGNTNSAGMDGMELSYVGFTFIRKLSDDAPWDGAEKYVYALYDGSGTPGNGWVDASSTYNGKYLKCSIGYVDTGDASGNSHSHEIDAEDSGYQNELGNGYSGYHHKMVPGHKHQMSLTSSETTITDATNRTFRIFKKYLGNMVDYNDALVTHYANGLYFSPALQLNVESFGNLYFNARKDSADTINFWFKTGATRASVEDGTAVTLTHGTELFTASGHGLSNGDRISLGGTLPTELSKEILYYVVGVSGNDFQVSLTSGGSAVEFSSNGTSVTFKKWANSISTSGEQVNATPNVWLAYMVEFIAADTTSSIPTLFTAESYIIKLSYRRAGTIAETAVEFIYETGFINHDEPMVDKIYKRIASEHDGDTGQVIVYWETENASSSWTVDLSRFPKRWQSFFHDTAMGTSLSIKYYKNDLNDFLVKEFKGFYTPQPMLI